MAESASRDREEVFRRLCEAGSALARCDGVDGVCLVAPGGRLVLRFGTGLPPETGDALARLVATIALARALAPDCRPDAPVFVHDGRNRVHARPVARDLTLLLFCDRRLLPGLAYRLVEDPLAAMREALADLPGEGAAPCGAAADPGVDDDIFWE